MAEDRPASPQVCVFAPSPLLTVTLEEAGVASGSADGAAEVHLHPGGQGSWVTNMVAVLGGAPVLCGPFGGETGAVLRGLFEREGVDVRAVGAHGSNGCYVQDRRTGELSCLADVSPAALGRHEVDDLASQVLAAAMACGTTVLTGPAADGVLPADVHGRLAASLTELGLPVVADLSGPPLSAALDGGLTVLKVSHEDLLEDGRAASDSVPDLVDAMTALAEHVSELVVLTRAGEPALALLDDRLLEVHVPQLEPVYHRGAGTP